MPNSLTDQPAAPKPPRAPRKPIMPTSDARYPMPPKSYPDFQTPEQRREGVEYMKATARSLASERGPIAPHTERPLTDTEVFHSAVGRSDSIVPKEWGPLNARQARREKRRISRQRASERKSGR